MKLFMALLLVLLLCPQTLLAAADAEDASGVFPVDKDLPMPAELSSVLHNLKQAQGFSASFTQALHFSDGSQQFYRGELEVLPPGRFRWRYTEPFEQLFISDGFSIWHYEPDLMQVSVLREMRDVDPSVMELLGGRLGIADVHLLEARPAEHRYYARLGEQTKVWLGVGHGRLDYVEGLDALGNRNRISLTDMHLQAPDAGRFAFVPPEGVDVVPLR